MIKFFLVFCLFFVSFFAYSQQDGDAVYSFGVRGYNYMALPKLLNQTENRQYINANFNSYIIKFNNKLYSYRLNGSYLNQSIQFANNCKDCEMAKGKIKDYSFKAGFEKNFVYGKVQPYFAFDLGYRSDEFDDTFRKRGFTVSPGFGLKVSPVKAISIFAESNMEFFYAWGKDSSAENNSGNNSYHRFRKGEYLFNPISVGIQVHFGHEK